MGNAILKACESIKAQLRKLAADLNHVSEETVVVEGGHVRVKEQVLTYAELLHAHFGPPRGELIGVGEERNPFDAGHPLGGKPAFWEMMCAACEVQVDVETGMVDILRLVLVSDIGKALNPQQVESQDEGAAVMGLGHTLMEHLILDEHGRIRNLGALDYRIPTIEDIPRTAGIDPDRERRWSGTVRRQGCGRGRNAGDRRGHRVRGCAGDGRGHPGSAADAGADLGGDPGAGGGDFEVVMSWESGPQFYD